MKDVLVMKRIFSVMMVSALVAACGGGGGSGSNERGPFAPVPDSVVYREGGAVIGMQVFDYSADNEVRSRFVVGAGSDGQWGTGDDVRKGGLTCQYRPADRPLSPARLSVVQNMGTNADGNFALQQLGLESDGRLSVCPAWKGKRLVREEVRCKGDFCPARYQAGYRMTIGQQHLEGGAWKQTQHVVFYGDNDQIATAPPFLSHIQTTELSGDEETGFEFLVTVEPSPEYPENVSLEQAALYAGNGYQKKVAQWLPDELESRVIIDRYGDNDSYVDTRYRTLTWIPEKGELMDSEANQNPPSTNQSMRVYGFDLSGLPVKDIFMEAGEDGIWWTADDAVHGFPEFIYSEDDLLQEMKAPQNGTGRTFSYDGKNLVAISAYGKQRRIYRYESAKLKKITSLSYDSWKGTIEQQVTFRDDVQGVKSFLPDQRVAKDEKGAFIDPLIPKERQVLLFLARPF